jgi:hypothetical protein
MASKPNEAGAPKFGPMAMFGQEPSESMANLQKELLEAYEQASRAWLARVKSEADLWSGLAAKLTSTRSVSEALDSYQKCVAQRMQMAAEDGRQMFEQCQNITQKITRALSNGRPTGSI